MLGGPGACSVEEKAHVFLDAIEPSESKFINVGQVCLAIKNIVDLLYYDNMPLKTFDTLWHKDLNAVRPKIQSMDFFVLEIIRFYVKI